MSRDAVSRLLGEEDESMSLEDTEQALNYGLHMLTVLKPLTMWKITGSQPSNYHYGNAQVHVPTAEEVQLQPGTALLTAHGVIYLNDQSSNTRFDPRTRTKLVFSDPNSKSPFEKSYGPGPVFAIAQRILNGDFEHVGRMS